MQFLYGFFLCSLTDRYLYDKSEHIHLYYKQGGRKLRPPPIIKKSYVNFNELGSYT